MATTERKLGVVPLSALVVGAIVGSGIFSLPQNMAEGAGAGAILIAWGITMVGMLTLTRVFQWLTMNRSDIDDGVYGYAREGFGDYMGFNAAWGYWISAWLGDVGYLVVMFSALGSFGALSFFGDGLTTPALIGQVIVLWLLHFFVLRGVRSAALLNALVTTAKIIPICLFIVCVALAFRVDVFQIDFWGSPALGSITKQVKATMLYTVWVFLGIESATVYASRAKDMITVSRATLLGFLITMALLVCVSVLSLGIVPQAELAQMKNPSMSAVLGHAVGPWGAMLINIGLVISVGGALLAWVLLSAEMLYLSARGENRTAPGLFGKLNRFSTPAAALWLTNILITVVLLYAHANEAGYNKLIQLATSMALIPYLLCAAFSFKLALKAESKSGPFLLMTGLGTIYGIWLNYAAGMQYLLLSMILYAPGLLFFFKARRERGLKMFDHPVEAALGGLVLILALIALWLMASGELSL